MSTVLLHYDGWVTLPVAARQQLGLSTGDRLEVEVSGEALVLRRAVRVSASQAATEAEPEPMPEPQLVEAVAEAPAPVAPAPAVRRGPGRPRKTAVAALPQNLKTRGRRKAAPELEAQSA